MLKRVITIVALLLLMTSTTVMIHAQGDLAATLAVLSSGVEVQRAGTTEFIPINVETIVGVGDTVRTDEFGRALVTFFADGTSTELMPETEYRITEFTTDGDAFTIQVEVLAGVTSQQVNRILDAESMYEVTTPGMDLVARGTDFDIRVEADGRSAMIVPEGVVAAEAQGEEAPVEAGFGVRSEVGEDLSDVVEADSFEALDSALDGCPATTEDVGDVALRVRAGAGTNFQRVGFIEATDIDLLFGVTEDGAWYRIPFRGGFAWVADTGTITVSDECPALRVYSADEITAENVSLFTEPDPEIGRLFSTEPEPEAEATEETFETE